MKIGMIGLGRMGGNMARRLAQHGISVLAFDRSADARAELAGSAGIETAASLAALIAMLPVPRTVWLMLPAGTTTDAVLDALLPLLRAGDLVVDGANAHYRESQRHAAELAPHGVEFVDAGVSGGVWGLANGYGLMLGGSAAAIARLTPVLQALAPAADRGWLHCGAAGAGHFAKMVHNGIEYGLMQAYAEGFALLEARADLGLDVAKIAETWRHGTVIRSWLLDLAAELLAADATLDDVAPVVADSGEGRWTVHEALDQGVPAPVITAALMSRFETQGRGDYAARVLARLRQSFGGHAVTRPGSAG